MTEEFKGFGLQKQDTNVTENRNIYVGGSDVPVILGLSKYKNQYELALEKTGLKKREYVSNPYIVFGNQLEPQIREYINAKNNMNFVVDTYIDEEKAIRSNVDGIDKEFNILLEIKTHGKNYDQRVYEVQMQLYMAQIGCDAGWLALYERPSDFDTEFDASRLVIKEIERDDELINKIQSAIETFWIRCEFLKDNPEMTETEYFSFGSELEAQLMELKSIAPQLLERKAQVKAFEEREKEIKEKLYEVMTQDDIKKIEAPFIMITRVLPSKQSRFDSKKFKEEHPDLYAAYVVESEKKGYVKISEPKEVK
ncbi:YqaJ viral recombinase family protein [Aerococcus sp. 1KP-2016]|uniref:YqaJ viral recombinase family protein n=1 Tax=Aerococcus sp. 1KP-2016 TaxID=1981982 RepID=UPI000B9802AD|nr:YqaJ viral recombinase family protein [Aerococcus sp. 1KP-2016]OYQ68293.1 endonuclease [Aerococcus sp. 1KP-2016]